MGNTGPLGFCRRPLGLRHRCHEADQRHDLLLHRVPGSTVEHRGVDDSAHNDTAPLNSLIVSQTSTEGAASVSPANTRDAMVSDDKIDAVAPASAWER